MRGWTDLHCHWIANIDDGATTPAMGVEMLRRLYALGFSSVIATPHMRPGMFDNDRTQLETAFTNMRPHLEQAAGLPEVALSSEHYFDDQVYARVLAGEGLPYPGKRAVLLEFYDTDFPHHIDRLLGQLVSRGLVPVIAHPERYRPLWKNADRLEQLLDIGAVALLDTAALVGKYGRGPRRCAEALLERGLYYAACSDAHRPDDVGDVARGIELIQTEYGEEELEQLLLIGPRDILRGEIRYGVA